MKLSYNHTKCACYFGYVTQAVVNNLSPLLFVLFNTELGISFQKIGIIITVNFCVQILIDLLTPLFENKLGCRTLSILAEVTAALGLFLLFLLPFILDNSFIGILIATIVCAIGGGLLEVLVGPIIESLPGDKKSAKMALLHSFYCWGHVAVVLFSSLFFLIFGIQNWRVLPLLWMTIPIFTAALFAVVPLCPLAEPLPKEKGSSVFKNKYLYIFALIMVCAGAAEQAVSQWSSLFAESGLKINKTAGDLLGPCAFACFMGLSRLLYGKFGANADLKKYLMLSSICCAASYFVITFSPFPLLSLFGCAMSGFFVGILWPASTSLSCKTIPRGGVSLFSILAFGGDVGCAAGPALVGFVSDYILNSEPGFVSHLFSGDATEIALKAGITIAALFPITLTITLFILKSNTTANS